MTLGLVNATNARDLGGYVTADGQRVRSGLVFRANALNRLTDQDQRVVAGLGLACVVDFRSEREVALVGPDRLGATPLARGLVPLPIADPDNELFASVTAMVKGRFDAPSRVDGTRVDGPDISASDVATLRSALATAGASLDAGSLAAEMVRAYRWLATAELPRQAFGTTLRLIAGPDAVPLLFHCTAGKDRTGWLAAVLLTALGVDRADVEDDYLRTTELSRPSTEFVLRRLTGRLPDPAAILPLLEARLPYLQAAFGAVEEAYGDLGTYLQDGLGIDAATLGALRQRLLTT